MTAQVPSELLLTGATGFVGKVILEAALRRSQELGIGAVHVAIRAKGGRGAAERFAREVAASRCFDGLEPGWESAVRPVDVDLSRPDAGLDAAAREALAHRVTHVIHAAASVEFDLPLAAAVADNVTASLRVLELARGFPRLARLVSLSTAYVTPAAAARGPVEEKPVPLPWPAADVIAAVADGSADESRLLRESGHPNTYTLSKCLAEDLLAARRGDVPLTLVRPSIVSASWCEPFPGWIDSHAAFAAFVVLVGTGQLRAVAARPDARLDIVPCDAVARAALDACFAPPQAPRGRAQRGEAERRSQEWAGERSEPAELRIVHAVAGSDRSAEIRLCAEVIERSFASRGAGFGARLRYVGPRGARFAAAAWLHHDLRLAAAAAWQRVRGRPARVRAVRSLSERLAYLNRVFAYFTHTSFDFRAAAPCELPDFTPRAYLETVCEGIYTLMREGSLRRKRGARGAPREDRRD